GEFDGPQRLNFDVLIRIDSGSSFHTVDFTGFLLEPGDLLWVRAGQVQQWDDIDAIDGPVFLFSPAAIDDLTHTLIRSAAVAVPNHWPATDFTHTAAAAAFTAAATAAATGATPLGRVASTRLLGATLLLLAAEQPAGSGKIRTASHDAFLRFRDEIEAGFRTHHKVTEYAARLSYSTRTLNRLARENTGLSAKELIDERVILEAKRLLAHSPDTVTRIAEHLGFDDQSNFAKYFHHRTATTPIEFRTRIGDHIDHPAND
ncbi:helix-turn-helix domain-containing protein, partial [Nocardia sp. NPDC055029]